MSVVAFARDARETIAEALRSLAGQEGIDRAEVIVADGSSDGTTAIVAGFPWVRHLRLPPGTMPALKGAAIREARGEIVAILDPTDAAEAGWIRAIVAGLADPSVTAVGGTVVLGGPRTGANAAAYLFEYGAFNPPVAAGATQGDLPGNNCAYRASALLDTCGDLLAGGFWKPFFHARIRERGGQLHIHPALQVQHLTRHRLLPFGRARFHYGRCFGAMRIARARGPLRVLYVLAAPAVPALLFLRHVARALRHPGNRRLLPRALPALLAVCFFWGVGEMLGTWLGPGRSCARVY